MDLSKLDKETHFERRYKMVKAEYDDYMQAIHAHYVKAQSLPHCDSLVLHSPGACEICDRFAPDLQEARKALNIQFTDDHRVGTSIRPCPATLLRPVEKIEQWPGNRHQ